jgi:endonuclease-3
MDTKKFVLCLGKLEAEYDKWDAPAKHFAKAYHRTPYTVLVSTLLSFQTRDETTLAAAVRLFRLADTPAKMLELDEESVARTIYPVGFSRKKAASVLYISSILLESYGGKVPHTMEELTSIKGIGPKTARIVLERAFGQAVAAVDTHVHRILNLMGFVETSLPEETDRIIHQLLPPQVLYGLNRLLVSFGQTVCRPRRPRCGECPIRFCCRSAK